MSGADFHRLAMIAQFNLAQQQSAQLLAVSGSNTGSFNAMISSRMATEAANQATKAANANFTGFPKNQFDPPAWVTTLNSSSVWGH